MCRQFRYDGGGVGKGGGVTLYVDGSEVGAGRVEATVPTLFYWAGRNWMNTNAWIVSELVIGLLVVITAHSLLG